MIRNVVLHLLNEQPLHADLLAEPTPGDVTVVCTNVRLMNGQRPAFVDDLRSTFIFPYTQMRFIEIPATARAAAPEPPPALGPGEPSPGDGASDRKADPALDGGSEPEGDLGLDEELLRRVREL